MLRDLRQVSPETPISEVFDRSYELVDGLIEEVDGLGESEHVSSRRRSDVPGTELAFDSPREQKAPGGVYTTSQLVAPRDGESVPLIARTRLVKPVYGQATYFPSKASAFRRGNPDVANANYAISRGPSGLITCQLGYVSAQGLRPVEEPAGTTANVNPDEAIGNLDKEDVLRIKAVLSAVSRNVGIVESMALGSSLEDALAEAPLTIPS